jgi:Bardet-Biedl syndrome 7 protein
LFSEIGFFFIFRQMNIMKITGSFSYAEIHSWIQFCLADVPERPPVDRENRLTYTNIFLQTQLECIYRYSDYFQVSDICFFLY